MRVLIIDNNFLPDPIGSPELQKMARLAPLVEFRVRRAADEDLPASPRGFDRIIISGSRASINDDTPWLDHQMQFIRETIEAGIPLLGVCHGHQSIARALGGRTAVRRAAREEYGWTKMTVLHQSPLLAGLPDTFWSFSAHNDEVSGLPSGLRAIASSADCGVQAMDMPGKPVFGIQFHPEKDLDLTAACFAERRADGHGKTLLHPQQSAKHYQAKIGETIFNNFFGSAYPGAEA